MPSAEETGGWTPRSAPEEVYGEVETYRNIANLLGGTAAAYGLLAFAWLYLGPWFLPASEVFKPAEAMRYGLPLAVISEAILCVVTAPWVKVRRPERVLEVRNPVSRVIIPLSEIDRISRGRGWFPVITTKSGQRVRLLGLQQSTLHYLHGGSEELIRLRHNLAALPVEGNPWTEGKADLDRSLAPPTPTAVVALLGWVAWLILTLLR